MISIRVLLALASLTLCVATAHAQTYPARAVKVIVPNTAGSGVDIVGRAVAQRLQEAFGQPFVVAWHHHRRRARHSPGSIAASGYRKSPPWDAAPDQRFPAAACADRE